MRTSRLAMRATLIALVLAVPVVAAAVPAPDRAESGSEEKIAEYTTDPRYLPEIVSYVPESSSVPSPSDHLGRLVGTPDELTRVDTIHDYFGRLAHDSPRVQVKTIGRSNGGRDILLATISSEQNLAQLQRYYDITAQLADPRETDRALMERLAADGKVVYHILAGLHSTETGSPEMVMELAYRLAVSEIPEIQRIRENVIVLITPVVEPDGRDRVVDWYYRHLKGRDLPFHELRRFSSPPYWGDYVFHDNNRDGMQLTLPLTRAINSTFFEAHPQVLHDLHESLPLLYISTGHGPYSDALDPVTISEWTQFAYHETSELSAMGLPGVWTWGFWDGWWPGYLFSVANNHNSTGRFFETFGNSMAGTFERELDDVKYVGKPVTTEQWYRPWPPDSKVTWSLRNNTNYMQAGVLEALQYAAGHRTELLRNSWIKAERSLTKGRTEAPYAWIFPEDQKDIRRLDHLVNLLQEHRIEVHRLGKSFETDGKTFPKNSYVVRMDQPYRNGAKNLLEEQSFPEDEANPPYDDVAWTWPLMFGVEGTRIDDAAILDTSMGRLTEPLNYEGKVEGDGPIYLIEDHGQIGLMKARFILGDRRVEAIREEITEGGVTYPAGSWIVRIEKSRAQKVARDFGLTLRTVDRAPNVPVHLVDLPRIGVLHTWTATQDCGWVRYALDNDGIAYTLLSPDDVRAGRLRNDYDVIFFPRTRGDLSRIVHGIDPAYGPLPYVATTDYPSHGTPNGSPDITGGMGFSGLGEIDQFVRDGGVLITALEAGRLPVDGGIVRNVSGSASQRTPGSIVRAKANREDHPILYGYDRYPTVFRGSGPIFEVGKHDRDKVVLQFGLKNEDPDRAAGDGEADPDAPTDKRVVLSGAGEIAGKLDGKPAILDLPVGRGRVILFNFNPMHRHLNLADYRFVYNAFLYWNDMAPAPQAQSSGD